MVITGLDRLLHEIQPDTITLKKANIGMITNHTSVTSDLKLGVEQLIKNGFSIKKILGPEHGFRGNHIAGASVTDEWDERTGLPVYSLYGSTKMPSMEMLEGLDALVFDMQDIGVRYYTYIYTMAYCMEAAAEADIDFYVLDRPNPLTGDKVEGNILDMEFRSFVGNYPIATRHGLTIGELANLFNQQYQIGCSLKVITMKDWTRDSWFDQTGLQWVMPSPNSTGLEMGLLYPGTCLFEGTNLSEGRGTTRPFELIGAPWIIGNEWSDYLNGLSLKGVLFRETSFIPLTSKQQGLLCQGVQVHVIDRNNFEPFKAGCAMIQSLKNLYPDDFKWLEPNNGRYFIDLLTGTNQFRKAVDDGRSIIEWAEHQQDKIDEFIQLKKNYHLY